MDERVQQEIKNDLPLWSCDLEGLSSEKPHNVGDVLLLKCSGLESIASQENYTAKYHEKFENGFKILNVKKDLENQKVFEVAFYRVLKGDLLVTFESKGQGLFNTSIKGLQMQSVVKDPNNAKSVQPATGFFLFNSINVFGVKIPSEVVGSSLIVFALLIIAIGRAFKSAKNRREYQKVVSKARYADPFLDFGIEIRNFQKEKKATYQFLENLEATFKKFFYRVFKERVSFDNMARLEKNLRSLKLEPHLIRSFYVLEEEYKRFKEIYDPKDMEKSKIAKSEFLEHSKKTVGKLKRYVEAQS